MFQKLFGATEEEQMRYLEKKVFAAGLGVLLLIVGGIFALVGLQQIAGPFASIASSIYLVLVLMFGFRAIKSLMGWGSVAAIFSGNIAIGSVIFGLSFIAACFVGILIALLGIGRYIYLKVKATTEREIV